MVVLPFSITVKHLQTGVYSFSFFFLFEEKMLTVFSPVALMIAVIAWAFRKTIAYC